MAWLVTEPLLVATGLAVAETPPTLPLARAVSGNIAQLSRAIAERQKLIR